ncbi:MAG: cytochrome P450 [Bdellovibrionota bacterium]
MTTNLDLSKVTKQTSLLDIKRGTTPAEYAAFLRGQGKIFFWDAAQFYVVTDYKLAQEVVKNPAFSADRGSFFVSRMPNVDLRLIKDFFGIVGKMMVMSDGADHEKRRKAAALGIDGELLEFYKPLIEKTVSRLVDLAASKGHLYFAREIAEPLPGIVLAELFCIDAQDREGFYDSALTMTRFFGGAAQYNNEEGKKVNDAALHIKGFFQKLIEKRRAEPRKDFFTILLANQAKFGLSDDEIIAQAVMMLVAGQVTTTDQLNNNMYQLLTTGALEQLQKNPANLATAIEEFNRLDPGVTYLFRTVKQSVELGGIQLKPEDVMFISNHAVNRDPELFADPDQCKVDRAKNAHFAYGHGPHFCLGARLARLQMQACFDAFVRKFPALGLDPDKPAVRNHYALSFSGFESLPLLVR